MTKIHWTLCSQLWIRWVICIVSCRWWNCCSRIVKINKKDGIPACFIQAASKYFAAPQRFVINLCIQDGKVPDLMKNARIKVLYKKRNVAGHHATIIDQFPHCLGLYEKKSRKHGQIWQIQRFISTHEIITPWRLQKTKNLWCFVKFRQKGIQSFRSWSNNFWHCHRLCQGIWYNQPRKVEICYAFDGKALEWFSSYLSFRFQYISFKNYTSANLQITCGVLQGSILGPTMLIICLCLCYMFILFKRKIAILIPLLFADILMCSFKVET